ncbi:homocysteine S-methyltransferase family protein [Candidatus Dependentiae bacterium]|nr:homocysteine S-methyltransferase family protein [Candidatus Dependentiae bacterium]
MNKKQFADLCSEKILILDGATGTELQKYGIPKEVCPEKWVFDNPKVIQEIQKKYVNSGSDIVFACTFGANRIKLSEYGLENELNTLNKKLVEISKNADKTQYYVAGDVAPTGRFVEPFGDLKFEEAVSVFKEQIAELVSGGADLIVIETMMDIQETRAALIAAKEICNLPVMVTMTFSDEGRTLTGTDSITALITLQSLGADAFGCNCSTGPESMIKLIEGIKPYAKIPLIAKPNAGLPLLKDGKTYFSMNSEEFGKYIPKFIEAGVNIIGGCCGTTPDYIKQIKINTAGIKPNKTIHKTEYSAVTSSRKTFFFGKNYPTAIIGERINPTGKKNLQEELKSGKFNIVRQFAFEQTAAGASILDVNVGMPNINEKQKMIETIGFLSKNIDTPLCLDSSDPDTIESALRLYPGRALINSISGEPHKIDKLLDAAKKYGAMFIILPLNSKTVPKTSSDRIEIINQIISESVKRGFTNYDYIVDGLVMTISSNPDSAIETLQVIKYCSEQLNCNTVIGLSNISFGLPERSFINSSFLTMAAAYGLTLTIANPSDELLISIKSASDSLLMKDKNCKLYIHLMTKKQSQFTEDKNQGKTLSPEELIFNAVLEGDYDNIEKYIKSALDLKSIPEEIINKTLIPAISKVGELFDKKQYFLPQLISSAETMKKGFKLLEPMISKTDVNKKLITVVMATVKGDIHDIGKNIVSLMMKNYGINVIDLGKDVSAENIIDAALNYNADFIALSALMTTTMPQMKIVADMVKQKNIRVRIIVGGAVVTQKYAEEIGVYGYAGDAFAAVKLVGC